MYLKINTPKIAAIVYAWPRMEWTFFEEWCSILKDKGVSKVYLGSNYPEYKVWNKKPNPKYYHLDKSNEEIRSIWNEVIERSRLHIEIQNQDIITTNLNDDNSEYINPEDHNYHHQNQIKFINDSLPLASQEGFDWVIVCDVDEIPIAPVSLKKVVTHYRNFDVIMAEQIVFDSRWDKNKNFAPRKIKEIKKYNRQPIPLMKCLFRPDKVVLKTVHEPVEPCNSIKATLDKFVIHHFRGIEKVNAISVRFSDCFDATCVNPTQYVSDLLTVSIRFASIKQL